MLKRTYKTASVAHTLIALFALVLTYSALTYAAQLEGSIKAMSRRLDTAMASVSSLQQEIEHLTVQRSSAISTSVSSAVENIAVQSVATTDTVVEGSVQEPQPIVPITKYEEELLARLVIAESGNQPYKGQLAVAQVVCDRYAAGYGDSITDVIYAKNQFATPYAKSTADYPLAYDAVYAVLYEGERAFTETTLFFCNPETSNPDALAWMRTKPYIGTIANHEFYGA